jgi:hypothetical protein
LNLDKAEKIEDLDHENTARFLLDLFHRLIFHHVFWFNAVKHQLGTEKAFETLGSACERSYAIQMKRLAKLFGFQIKDGVPGPMLQMSKALLLDLVESVAKNWLANDGVWFQAVEFSSGMNAAKRCNDSCWAQFSTFEAWSIKTFLNLPEKSGLEGLKRALNFRIYARINTQSWVDEGPDSCVYQMNECRVQTARKRKGLDDYPCKSGGLVEYTYFARAIDPRIQTECVACPPDDHPAEWYCAWRFKIQAG